MTLGIVTRFTAVTLFFIVVSIIIADAIFSQSQFTRLSLNYINNTILQFQDKRRKEKRALEYLQCIAYDVKIDPVEIQTDAKEIINYAKTERNCN